MVDVAGSERRRELDKEMSSYISSRRKSSRKPIKDLLKRFKKKNKSSDVELHPEVSAYGNDSEEIPKKSKQELEEEETELEKDFEEGSSKKSLFEWLREFFVFEKEPDESLEEAGERHEKEEYEEEKEKEPETEEEKLEDEYEEELEKEGWIDKIISKIFVKTKEEETVEDAEDIISEDQQDMKAIAEIATKVMKKLPPEELKALKQSEDFETFKEILKKRELIR